MLKIAICDDEIEFAGVLSQILKNFYVNQIREIFIFDSPQKLIVSKENYDIIFLDIDMPVMNGIELSKKYMKTKTEIIFVTNKEALVFEAYNSTESFGFIRKNQLKQDLFRVMQRYFKLKKSEYTLKIKFEQKLIALNNTDVIYIEKQVNSVIIHTAKKNYKIRKTLSELESELEKYGFVRTHIGYLINLDYIDLIEKNQVILKNKETVPISRNRYKFVCDAFIKRSILFND